MSLVSKLGKMLSFHVKFVQTDRRTDGRTDGQRKTICPPILRYGGIKRKWSKVTSSSYALLMHMIRAEFKRFVPRKKVPLIIV